MTNEEAADVIDRTLKKYDKPKTKNKNKDLAEFQEALRLAITALSHPPAPPEGWQPIETAPNGDVLLYFPAVYNERRKEQSHGVMVKVGWASAFPNRVPSHWRPIPAPPAPETP